MTLREVCNQLYDLSLDGFFAHERFSRDQLYNKFAACMPQAHLNKIPNTFVFEIALPDGWWLFTINKLGNEFDYWIPDTREEEQALKDRFYSGL